MIDIVTKYRSVLKNYKLAVFIGKAVVLSILITLSFRFFLELNPYFGHDYIASGLKIKLEKIQQSNSPKIILISGSSGANGINSKQIEDELGVDFVNMALFAGFSTKFILEYVKPYINEGDIVLYAKEFVNGSEETHYEMRNNYGRTAIFNTPSESGLILSNFRFLSASLDGFIKACRHTWSEYPKEDISYYYNKSFVGDNVRTSLMTAAYDGESRISGVALADSTWILVKELKDFDQFVQKQQARTFIIPPPAGSATYTAKNITQYITALSKETQIPILNNTNYYLFKKQHGTDAQWHTNYIGRYLRTKDLIKDLKTVVQTKKVSKPYSLAPSHLNLIPSSMNRDIYGFTEGAKNEFTVNLYEQKQDNYIRYFIPDKDLSKCFYYLRIQAEEELVKNIILRIPTGGRFDFISHMDENTFLLVSRLPKSAFTNEQSSFGLTLANIHQFGGQTFKILEEGVFFDVGDIPPFNVNTLQYELSIDEQLLRKTKLTLNEYLSSLLKSENKLILMTTRGGKVTRLNEIQATLVDAGLSFIPMESSMRNYTAIFDTNGQVYFEEASSENQHYIFKGPTEIANISRLEIQTGSKSVIRMNNTTLGRNFPGLNIVVLDLTDHHVFDAIEMPFHENPTMRIVRSSLYY